MSSPNALFLPKLLHTRIGAEGAAAFPKECCGMIIGRDVDEQGVVRRVVDRLVAGPNVFEAEEQYHRFLIDPLTQLKTERAAEAEGKTLLGFYHSHPNHPARPSEYDRQHAWPFYSYIIVSIQDGVPADLTSWVLDEAAGAFMPQKIVDV